MAHTEIPIKVWAWVDEGVAPLVGALNEIDGVLTLDSCEQGPLGEAFVFFTYGHDWRELAALMQEVSEHLSENTPYGYSMNLEWLGSNVMPRAQVLVRPEHAASLATAISRVAPQINRRMLRGRRIVRKRKRASGITR